MAVTAVTVGCGGSAATPQLLGTVRPGFSIDLRQGGRPVQTLSAGVYLITVGDRSAIHDFHLRGPGVNKVITSVAFVGTKTIKVRLIGGLYSFRCDPDRTLMHGTFRVR
jgi:hypothetical protein